MFRDEKFIRPSIGLLVTVLLASPILYILGVVFPLLGYLLCLSFLILVVATSLLDMKVWPTRGSKVRPWLFVYYWSTVCGLIFPFLTITIIDGGVVGLWDLLWK